MRLGGCLEVPVTQLPAERQRLAEVGRGGHLVAAIRVGEADEGEGLGLGPPFAEPPPDGQRGREVLERGVVVMVGPVGLAKTVQVVGLVPGQPGPSARFSAPAESAAWVTDGRNDLEGPAIAAAPAVAEVLAALRALPDCRLARMSGSGATCFALFPDCHAAARGARALRTIHPGWWISPTLLR